MSTLAPTSSHTSNRTLADLLRELGGIAPDRILLTPAPGTAAESDLLRLVEVDKVLCELVEGTLVEKAMGVKESLLALALARFLHDFIRPRNLGILSGPDGTLRLWEGLVRLPDVAFICWDRLPGRMIPDEPIPEVAPDLAVEVLSKGNTRGEMERKRGEYFAGGTRLVWEVDPRKRTVAVYTSPDSSRTFSVGESIDGGDVLPGFSLPLTLLFGELDQHG
jgi:Uma2 family endonuclease